MTSQKFMKILVVSFLALGIASVSLICAVNQNAKPVRGAKVSKSGVKPKVGVNVRKKQLIMATFADRPINLHWAMVMVESIRSFGGSLRDSEIRIYIPENRPELDMMLDRAPESLRITVRKAAFPPEVVRGYPLSHKVFVSAQAEKEALNESEILVWLDHDTVFVKEPSEFLLPAAMSLGYRPVQIQIIGSEFGKEPDEYWGQIYKLLSIPESNIFSMKSCVDQVDIRPYFNVGMLVVRPEKGILKSWANAFLRMCSNAELKEMCRRDEVRALFLHQAAFVSVLKLVKREEMKELPESYNFPMTFINKYPVNKKPKSFDDLVSFRHDMPYSDTLHNEKLRDGSAIYAWLIAHAPVVKKDNGSDKNK